MKLWELFVLLAEHRHFGRAARAGGLTQPALSQHISHLERTTGCRLFVRTTRSVELSPAGTLLLPHVQRLLRDLRALSNAATRFERRTGARLRLGLPAHLGSGAADEVARRLQAVHRDSWEFEVVRLGARDLGEALGEGTVDLGLMHLPLAAPDLACSPPVLVEARGVVLAAGHPLAARPTLRARDLVDQVVLPLDEETFGPAGSPWSASGPEAVGRRRPLANLEELLDAIVLGQGVAVAPMSDAERLRSHGLVHVPLLDVDSVALVFVWHRAGGSPIPEAQLPRAAGWFAPLPDAVAG